MTKFNIDEKEMISCIQKHYGLKIQSLDFLPLGADFNTNVYRFKTDDKLDYFLKLRRNEFAELSVYLPPIHK
jgi:spectinomycin phosphotransferase